MILTKCNIKEINLDEIIQSRLRSSLLNELLLIVPTNRKVRYLKRELISASPTKAISGINLETLGTYSSKLLLGESWQNFIVSEETSIVILAQCFRETELKYFSNYGKEIPFGTLERVKNVISEYKKHGISPQKLLLESNNLEGTEQLKAEDISRIYNKYEEKFSQLGIKELGDIYKALTDFDQQTFESRFNSLYPEVKTLIVNGFDEFTIPEIEIVSSSYGIKNIDLYLNFDYYNYNPAIFSHLDDCYKKLERKGFKNVRDSSVTGEKTFIEDVKQNLFLGKDDGKKKNYQSNITHITAFNRENEVTLIAKEIKSIINEKKTEPNRICVGFNLIKPYSQIIRDQFVTYGIPFNLTDRLSISTSSPVISIINFLEILANDFYYKNIFRALGSNLVNIPDVDLDNLLKVSVELKIVSGLKNWTSKLQDTINESLLSDIFEEGVNRYNINYEKALNDLNNIYKLLKPFDWQLTPSIFYKNLRDLISSLNIHVNVLSADEDYKERDIKALTVFFSSVKEMLDLFEQEYGVDKKHSLRFYLKHLTTIASFSRYNIKEKHGYGVLVTTLNEIRGLNFDYLFIAGMADGDFPTRFSPEIFFSGSFAKQDLRHQVEERYLFYQALCCWQKGLYLTNPLTDERKELVESGFLREFMRKFSISEKDGSCYENTISSKIELQRFVGKRLGLNEKDLELPADVTINLNKVNQNIEINRHRLETETQDSIYSGLLTAELTDELREKLEAIKDGQFSVTQLESYAKCPFKYFAERVLHLNTIEEPSEEIEAFEMGNLLHSILYEFYTTIKEKGIILQKASEKDFKKANKILFEVAQKNIDNMKLSSVLSFYEKEKLLGIGNDEKNSLLYQFLVKERGTDDGFIPEYFETMFGNQDNDVNDDEEDFKIGDIKVRGKIDRIDISETDKTLKVIDYKLSGKKPSKDDLLLGLSLQLPLYMIAAGKIISERQNKQIEPLLSQIYSLKFSEKDFGPQTIRIDNSKSVEKSKLAATAEQMMNNCIELVNGFVNDIALGKFNLSSLENREEKVCKYCNFRSVCRVQEIN